MYHWFTSLKSLEIITLPDWQYKGRYLSDTFLIRTESIISDIKEKVK
ncbi:unnamed protein product [Brugia timori]|uniref:Uncharacterized protein n=1 Tax=Brugia timori TaxID=42155 RepID=A0A0R3Q7Z0_9BILA|nr:unnamed protein product [Brugia timori]